MAKSLRVSTKRLMINKANTTIVVAVAVAASVVMFSLVTAKSLLSKRSYQSRVVAAREKARDQLKDNLDAVGALQTSYEDFASRPENILGGSSAGTGPRDGDNPKLALDALPSKYDFPALTASLEKIMDERNYVIQSISGIDDEALYNSSGGQSPETSSTTATNQSSQQVATVDSSAAAQSTTPAGVVDMPFEVAAKGSYASLIDLVKVFQYSIRPMNVQKLVFTADDDGSVTVKVSGKSYYQPAKSLSITEEVVQ